MARNAWRLACAAALLLAGAAVWAAEEMAPEPVAESGRRPASVMSYLGAAWLERPDRDAEQQPDAVIAAMELKPGMAVADIGSGSGYFTRRLAPAVGASGTVYAVDVQPEMNTILAERLAEAGIENVTIILGDYDDPKLPPNSLDWILLVDTYHEFQDPKAMLAKMRKALKPTGKVALVEYRLLGDTAKHIKEEHRMSIKQVLAEWNPAGFELVDLLEFLPTQHYFIFGLRGDCP